MKREISIDRDSGIRPFWQRHPRLAFAALVACLPVYAVNGAVQGVKVGLYDFLRDWREMRDFGRNKYVNIDSGER